MKLLKSFFIQRELIDEISINQLEEKARHLNNTRWYITMQQVYGGYMML